MTLAHTSFYGDGEYPHVGGCPACTFDLLCNGCGDSLREKYGWISRCTNGRCSKCHGYCTSGGDTSSGHGYGTPPKMGEKT